MAKRSPILGYNHNVRYRGLIFHVQTEDSGMMSPHLFTHLFHGGVIISTRKLVYDAGSAEDSIKSLMQAQHKAVLKDLRKGSFDEKIDEYLGSTPGLLPRGGDDGEVEAEPARASAPVIPAPPVVAAPAAMVLEDASSRAPTEADLVALEPPNNPLGTPPPLPSRTRTAERGSAPSQIRTNLPPPPTEDAPTLTDDSAAGIAAAIAAANATVPTRMPDFEHPSEPEIEIELELDEPDELPRARKPRDTDIEMPDDAISRAAAARGPRPQGESVPPLPAPPHAHPRASSALGGSTLPPARPIARPPSRQAITPPQVVSRPLAADQRRPGESDAVEVYAAAPPSAEPPPGAAGSERPGQYAQHKRVSQKLPVIKERPGGGSVSPGPAGGGRPSSISTSPIGVPKAIGGHEGSASGIPQAARDRSSGTPQRPSSARVEAPTSRGAANSGVVMTRPAVIVGAPAKSPTQPRIIRKAREEEGRGFGQGLISEKSLDEVILAYLSEDADEK